MKLLRVIGFFALRGMLGGAILGAVVGVVTFIAGGDATPNGILAGAVLGLIYGAIFSFIFSIIVGLIIWLALRITSNRAVIIGVAALAGLLLPLAAGALLFAGPFNDASFITFMVLSALVNGVIAFLLVRRVSGSD